MRKHSAPAQLKWVIVILLAGAIVASARVPVWTGLSAATPFPNAVQTKTARPTATRTAPHTSTSAIPTSNAKKTPPAAQTAADLSTALVLTPQAQSPAEITFHQPLPFSSLLSPVQVQADLIDNFKGSVRLELVDSRGKVISRKVIAAHDCAKGVTPPPESIYSTWICTQATARVITALHFGINSEKETARLQIALVDSTQRVRSLNSLPLTLLAKGKIQTPPTPAPAERITILQPAPNASLRGKTMTVSGTAPLTKSLPLRVEVISANGKVINTRMVSALPESGTALTSPQNAPGSGAFRVDMDLKSLKSSTKAIIIISASDEDLPGIKYLTSREVFLNP